MDEEQIRCNGWLALGFIAFDPNIIAHGRYVTNDLPVTLFFFLTVTQWIDFLEYGGNLRLAGVSAAFGLALASKEPIMPTFLKGIEVVRTHQEQGHLAYLLGEFSTDGWWYYFPVAFAVKTPSAVLFLTFVAIVIGAWQFKKLGIDTRVTLGGVHLKDDRTAWRWDWAAGRLVRPTP